MTSCWWVSQSLFSSADEACFICWLAEFLYLAHGVSEWDLSCSAGVQLRERSPSKKNMRKSQLCETTGSAMILSCPLWYGYIFFLISRNSFVWTNHMNLKNMKICKYEISQIWKTIFVINVCLHLFIHKWNNYL